jgi:hypothetical protein
LEGEEGGEEGGRLSGGGEEGDREVRIFARVNSLTLRRELCCPPTFPVINFACKFMREKIKVDALFVCLGGCTKENYCNTMFILPPLPQFL